MKNPLKVPRLAGEPLYIPFVGAILEREQNGRKEIVVQTRKKKVDHKYNHRLEIPGGKFRAYEDVYSTLKREVKEECGLDLTFIEGEKDRRSFTNCHDRSDLISPFCVTQMANGPFIGLIFLCRAEGELLAKTNETRNARWLDTDQLREIVTNHPEQIYTAFLAPLKKYLELT